MAYRRHAPGPDRRGDEHELLYDPEVPTPSHAERARTLVAQVDSGTLSTISRDPSGYPYGSLVTFGLLGAAPIFLISALAEHTGNLEQDPRCSLLIAEPGTGDPLARGRVTLVGSAEKLARGDDTSARRQFLTAHPGADFYVDYKDFNFWRLSVAFVRYIGGFGRMSWIDASDWSAAQPDPLSPFAAGILRHMNDDHAPTLALYCRRYSKATDTSSAQLTAVDRYGFEMSAVTSAGPRPIRLAFSKPVDGPEAVRQEMMDLARMARVDGS